MRSPAEALGGLEPNRVALLHHQRAVCLCRLCYLVQVLDMRHKYAVMWAVPLSGSSTVLQDAELRSYVRVRFASEPVDYLRYWLGFAGSI